MLHYKGLSQLVYGMHVQKSSTNKIVIISGYVGYQTIQKLSELPNNIDIVVIYGMYGSERISEPLHKALLSVHEAHNNISIRYATIPVHSKIYVWRNDSRINQVLVGSANFSVSGLMNDYKEVLSDIEDNPDYENLSSYIDTVLRHSIPCTDPDIKTGQILHAPRNSKKKQPLLASGICRAYLTNKFGLVSKKSGLNWGHSAGHVAVGDAYIAISMEYIHLFPHLFPAKKYVDIDNPASEGKPNRENDTIELIWDDGERMLALLEGQQKDKVTDLVYPKQLSSSEHKSVLGKYIRKRLGVEIDHVITKADLKRYGRDNIDISLIGDGVYYMDFSVK